jgi:hypothetical protein
VNEEENDDVLVKLNAYTEFGDDCDELTDWERGFMDDQIKRYEEYKERTRFSDKQMNIINRVYEKLPI